MSGELAERLPRGPHRLTRDEVESSQRRRLHHATLAAIAEDGYHAVSVTVITTRAGVSRRTFYQLFTSKDDCITQCLNDLFTRLDEQLTAAIQHHQPHGWRELITTSLRAYLAILAAEPHTARALHVEAVIAGPAAYPFRQQMMARFAERMRTAQHLGTTTHPHNHSTQLPTAPEFLIGGIDEAIRATMIARDFHPSNLLDLHEQLSQIALRLLQPSPPAD